MGKHRLYSYGNVDGDVVALIAFYDSNFNFISSIYKVKEFGNQFNRGIVTGEFSEFPSNAAYCRLSSNNGSSFNPQGYGKSMLSLVKSDKITSESIDKIYSGNFSLLTDLSKYKYI